MKGPGEDNGAFIAWAIGGFVFSTVVLFGIAGYLVLGLLMVVVTPFILGFLLVEAIFGQRPLYVASGNIERDLHTARQEWMPKQQVSMRITHGKGTCRLGYQFNQGSMWTLNGGLEGPTPLCPEAYRILSEYANHSRHSRAEAREMTLMCTNGQVVGLGLEPVALKSGTLERPSPARV